MRESFTRSYASSASLWLDLFFMHSSIVYDRLFICIPSHVSLIKTRIARVSSALAGFGERNRSCSGVILVRQTDYSLHLHETQVHVDRISKARLFGGDTKGKPYLIPLLHAASDQWTWTEQRTFCRPSGTNEKEMANQKNENMKKKTCPNVGATNFFKDCVMRGWGRAAIFFIPENFQGSEEPHGRPLEGWTETKGEIFWLPRNQSIITGIRVHVRARVRDVY